MRFVLLIALDTMRSLRRHRVLLAFLILSLAGMALVVTGISNAMQELERKEHVHANYASAGAATRTDDPTSDIKAREIIVTFNGLFAGAMSLAGSLLALVMFCTVVSSELHTGTIRVTLAKPVPRWAYLVGRWLGATAVLAAYCVLAGAASAVLGMRYHVQGMGLLASAPWLSFCGSLVLGAVGLIYSLFVRAPVAGVLAWFTSATWFSWLPPLYAVLPSYQPFDVWQAMMLGTSLGPWHLVVATLYTLDLVVILLLIAWVRFRRMEITEPD